MSKVVILLRLIFMVKEKNATILDSSLILTTNKKYNLKLVQCGDYIQLYFYNRKYIKIDNLDYNDELNLKKIKTKEKFDLNNKQVHSCNLSDNIEFKNIIRSKFECQRLAKSNMKDWKTFITLTFKENVKELDIANKKFRYFIDKIKRVKKDFKYLCVTEFQKRGAIHYHLLSNIDINDNTLMFQQEDNSKFYHIKYWNEGFTSVETMTNDPKKVVGYISKYMTKDIDNRLYNRHRYFFSRNLTTPKISYIDLDNLKDLDFYKKNIQDKVMLYMNNYKNNYDNSDVSFLEYLKK